MSEGYDIEIERIMISPGHNYFGRHGKEALKHGIEEVDSVTCVAGKGLEGDRFFDYKENYKGQITFFDVAVWRDLETVIGESVEPTAFRRNVLVSGVDLNTLIGCRFRLSGIDFEAVEECRPCYWMDQACAPGAEEALKGRGGLRCRILTNGVLKLGDASISLIAGETAHT